MTRSSGLTAQVLTDPERWCVLEEVHCRSVGVTNSLERILNYLSQWFVIRVFLAFSRVNIFQLQVHFVNYKKKIENKPNFAEITEEYEMKPIVISYFHIKFLGCFMCGGFLFQKSFNSISFFVIQSGVFL